MMKKSMMLCLTLLAAGCVTFAIGETYSGVVSESGCGLKHATASAQSEKCVKGCVARGAKYVLASNGKVYKLDAQDKFADFAGKAVKVTGTAKDDAITVESVEAAPADAATK